MGPLHQKYLETLRRTQWLEPDRLLTYQARLLEDISRHAYEHVPFYRDRLAPLFRGGRFDLRAWRDVPTLSRAEIMANAEAMRALAVPRHVARESEGRTSGTTGPSLRFQQSEIAVVTTLCQFERMLEAHSIDRFAHHARIRLEPRGTADYPDGAEDSGWNLSHPDARQSKLNIHTSISEQAEWLERRAPQYLTTYQSTAAALARHLESGGRKLTLGGLITSGETVDPSTREDVNRVFGCKIIDRYATTEMGNVAFQCPVGGDYHVCSETILLELLNSDGSDAAEGSRGRVVLTSFYNFAMPIVRYDIGDFAIAAHGSCTCGRTLPRLASIFGTATQCLYISRMARNIRPTTGVQSFQNTSTPNRFQLVQTSIDRIELRYIPRDGAQTPDTASVEEIGRKAIHSKVIVRAIPVAEIPRHPSGKIEDCVSLVVPPAQQQRATSDH